MEAFNHKNIIALERLILKEPEGDDLIILKF